MCRGKAYLEHVLWTDPGVQRDPPAAAAVGVDQWMYVAGDPSQDLGLRQRRDHQVAFPGAVALCFPMLEGAAAADSEMWAEWRDALRAGVRDLEQAPAVGMVTRHGRDLDGLAAKRVGHIHGLSLGQC